VGTRTAVDGQRADGAKVPLQAAGLRLCGAKRQRRASRGRERTGSGCHYQMMADARETQAKREAVEEAERHIAQAEVLLARQQKVVAQLERDGHNAEAARALLATMAESLEQMRVHRRIIQAELADGHWLA
jgi:hypothetical protein